MTTVVTVPKPELDFRMLLLGGVANQNAASRPSTGTPTPPAQEKPSRNGLPRVPARRLCDTKTRLLGHLLQRPCRSCNCVQARTGRPRLPAGPAVGVCAKPRHLLDIRSFAYPRRNQWQPTTWREACLRRSNAPSLPATSNSSRTCGSAKRLQGPKLTEVWVGGSFIMRLELGLRCEVGKGRWQLGAERPPSSRWSVSLRRALGNPQRQGRIPRPLLAAGSALRTLLNAPREGFRQPDVVLASRR